MTSKHSFRFCKLKSLETLIMFAAVLGFFAFSSSTFAATLYGQTDIGTRWDTGSTGHGYYYYPSSVSSTAGEWPPPSFYTVGSTVPTILDIYRISGNSCGNIPTHNSGNGISFLTDTGSGWAGYVYNSTTMGPICRYYLAGAAMGHKLGLLFALSQNTSGGADVVLSGNSGTGYTDNATQSTRYAGGPAFRLCDSTGCSTPFTKQVENVTADITTSTTWHNDKNYIISGDVEVTSGDTLTIEPGTYVYFDNTTSSSLEVNGNLNAIGDNTTAGKIYFSSTGLTPAEGDWGGITVGSGGEANFDYAVINYAGKTGSSEAGLYNNGGDLIVDHSFISENGIYGILNDSGFTDVTNTEIGFQNYGFYLGGGTADVKDNNIIHDNGTGIYNSTMTNLDATNNHWGDLSGPYNNPGNLSGIGNAVIGDVTFNPWIDDYHFTAGVGSVDNGEIRWDGSTQYLDEFDDAVDMWNNLGVINIAPDTILTTADLTISDIEESDIPWAGQWKVESGADTLMLNNFYLQNYSTNQIQNVITHELGHALNLDHSYSGNVMYFMTTFQTALGLQDEEDYNSLWP